MDTAVRDRRPGAPMGSAGPSRAAQLRWLGRLCAGAGYSTFHGAARLATLAAALCPALSSLGGALVGALLSAATCVLGLVAGPVPGDRRGGVAAIRTWLGHHGGHPTDPEGP